MPMTPNHPQFHDERTDPDMEKDAHISHNEQEDHGAMSSMFADAAIATGRAFPLIDIQK